MHKIRAERESVVPSIAHNRASEHCFTYRLTLHPHRRQILQAAGHNSALLGDLHTRAKAQRTLRSPWLSLRASTWRKPGAGRVCQLYERVRTRQRLVLTFARAQDRRVLAYCSIRCAGQGVCRRFVACGDLTGTWIGGVLELVQRESRASSRCRSSRGSRPPPASTLPSFPHTPTHASGYGLSSSAYTSPVGTGEAPPHARMGPHRPEGPRSTPDGGPVAGCKLPGIPERPRQ